MKRTLLIAVSLLLLSSCGGGSTTSEKSFISGSGVVTTIEKGSRIAAPTLTGTTLSDSVITIAPSISVVNVWASWCSPCRAEAKTLQALSEKYSNVSFVGILTRDTVSNGRAFVRTYGITYPTLVDDAILIGFRSSLPANAIPTTLVLDKEGKVAGRISGEITIASLSKLIDTVLSE